MTLISIGTRRITFSSLVPLVRIGLRGSLEEEAAGNRNRRKLNGPAAFPRCKVTAIRLRTIISWLALWT